MRKLLTLLFLSIIFLKSCAPQAVARLQNGDLIFVEAKTENLSGAISRVTVQSAAYSYDHVGIAAREPGGWVVYHAVPEGGSQREPLSSFVARLKAEHTGASLYRLKPQYRTAIPSALVRAREMTGKPYNFSYVLNENEYYCSDFVERAFRAHQIFRLEPMTFKNPETGITDPFWREFYRKRGMEVPEGEPGCNPNGLAKSDKIELVQHISFK